MAMRDNGCGCGANEGRRTGNNWQRDTRQREGGCGCGGNDVRRSDNNWQRDTRGGEGNCGCGRDGRPYRTPREGGCGCATRQARNDERRDCSCGGYDEPRMGYGQECCALMHRLQELDFSIQETILYLDAYPDCCEAKSYYQQLVCEREQVAKEYERQCGPLTAMGNGNAGEWNWCKTPWPWHHDFPGNKKV